jgi:tyrosyl-tRNA synthetase
MEVERQLEIIRTIGEEIVEEEGLRQLLSRKRAEDITCYDGFEPSGRIHIAQGILRALNTNKLTKCGFRFKFWVADWFAQLNLKFGGDLKKIRKAGELMIEIWRLLGMDTDRVEFIWASEEINQRADEYWSLVMDVAAKSTLRDVTGCCTIMGKKNPEALQASQIFYPCMQCADIFFLKVDICSLGIDQRKVNMLARDYCSKVKRKNKPVIVSHHMLMGLDGSDKMSKSNPDNAIFMDDAPHEVRRKVNRAFCPPTEEGNPVMEYFRYIVFEHPEFRDGFTIDRSAEHGGDLRINSYRQLVEELESERLHPQDVKATLVRIVNRLLEPVQSALRDRSSQLSQLSRLVSSYGK